MTTPIAVRKRTDLFPYLLIFPTVVLILGIMVVPVLSVFGLSVQQLDMTRIFDNKFVGVDNFATILTQDPLFWQSLVTTLGWVAWEVGLQVVFGLVVALLLNAKFVGRAGARALVFLPWAVSGVLTTMLWILLYSQYNGLINHLLLSMKLVDAPLAWLASPDLVFPSVVVAELWRGLPFFAITILAALQGIPKDVYEAADIDGCGPARRLWSITLAYLKGAILFSALLRCIWEFNSIDMIFTMTGGGPLDLTLTLPIYMMRTSVIEQNVGYGAALGTLSFVVLMVFALVYLKFNGYGKAIDE
jgi:multiple sugar transport system permease protein